MLNFIALIDPQSNPAELYLLALGNQLFDSLRVEPNDSLAIDNDDRSRHRTYSFEILDCGRVLRYIPFFKNDASLRKKLFRPTAKQSGRLAIDSDLSRH